MKLTDRIYSVGVANPTLRVFDIIMATGYGTTYNSYVVKGQNKTVVIDGSHTGFEKTWLNNVQEVTDFSDIDYMIINHTEPDHSGAVRDIIDKNPDIMILGTMGALKNLEAIAQRPFNKTAIKGGEVLDLGGITLECIVAPNVHWPDTMMVWCPEEKIAFTCDFLGAHFAEPTWFADSVYKKELYEQEFFNYYQAIMSPFADFVLKALDKLSPFDVKMVCPSHGPILRGEDVAIAMEKYRTWSTPVAKDRKAVSIYYVSAYGYTRKMCHYLEEKLAAKGLDVFIADIIKTNEDDLLAHLNADCLVFGSPTINRAALKPVWDVISSIDAIGAKGKPYATLGCYGWTGEACDQLNDRLNGIKMKSVSESIKTRFAPTEETWKQLDRMADEIAEAVK